MTSPSPDSPDCDPSALVAKFLTDSHLDMEVEFAELCAKHPGDADELHRLYTLRYQVKGLPPVFGGTRTSRREPPPSEGARVGDFIGDFRLVLRIASGGQGEVWEAEQASLGRRVALKLVLPDRINEKSLALFAREARAGGRLAHPGIVAIHGYGEDNGRHWIAQELVEGAWTLRDFIDEIRNQEQLPEHYHRAVAVFVAELAEALQAAHDAGVIHRDVKPQNVLITPAERPKLTDFGLARIIDEAAVSMTGDMAGTWLYMSPEQVRGKPLDIDHRTDIFSLGVVMYEMLALVRPFDGDTTRQVAENIMKREAPDLRRIRSRVPTDLAVICARALEKSKGDRFQTMGEFAADLRRHLAHEPIHAQPPSLLNRGAKWARRHPTRSLVGAVAATAFIAISALTLYVSDQEAQMETRQSELSQFDEGLLSANVVLAGKKTEAVTAAEEAHMKAKEAQVKARKVTQTAQDAWRLSLEQDCEDLVLEADTLWPAWPEKIVAMEHWLQVSEELIAELPALKRKRDELEAGATPRTEQQAQAEREAHPDYSLLAPLHLELAVKRSALAVRTGEAELELPNVDWAKVPSDAKVLNRLAWPMLDPERDTFGQEGLGLQLARRAVELARDAEQAEILDSVAWGSFAVGLDAEAIATSREAMEKAPKNRRAEFAGYLANVEAAVLSASGEAGLAAARKAISELDVDLAALESRLNERRAWTFPTSVERRLSPSWWHYTTIDLIEQIESLSARGAGLATLDGVSDTHGWSVPRRLESAQRLHEGFSPGGEFLLRWEEAAVGIGETYPGLDLALQIGLVPIGADPVSELWEFWHVASGTEPLRGEDGVLELEENSGFVFVLLPGGYSWMGAQSTNSAEHHYDKEARGNEGPVHEVELTPFFLSKYEMTQAQWSRLTGTDPSLRTTKTWSTIKSQLHPVEQVTWYACDKLLARLNLALPSEAQWEYGCRSGTDGPRPFEDDEFSTFANIQDEAYKKIFSNGTNCEQWDDGYANHCPVGSLRPNSFGLHEMTGNVGEWCADGFEIDFYGRSSGVDPVNLPPAPAARVHRGGCFGRVASAARSALRASYSPRSEDYHLGLRPARGITPPSFATSPLSDD